jgi:hypothetical protein
MTAIVRLPTPRGTLTQLVLAQGVATAIAFSAVAVAGLGQIDTILPVMLVFQAALAAVTARLLGMSPWWITLNLLFGPALWVALSVDVDPTVYGAAFVTMLLVYGTGAATHKVPVYLTGRRALAELERWLPHESFSMIDLGAGTGRVLEFVARRRPDARLQGVEIAPLPFALAWLRGLWGGYDVKLREFQGCDLSRFDIVYAYLSPAPMERLWEKVEREMRPGTLFISNSFAVPGVRPAHVVRYGVSPGAVLHVWRIPDRKD